MMTMVGVTSTTAYADTTIGGCTIVAHPNATRFTDCPGAFLAATNLSGVNLSFANLSGANLGRRVVIGDWDGRHMGTSLAELLATRGHEVTIVSSAFFVGMDIVCRAVANQANEAPAWC